MSVYEGTISAVIGAVVGSAIGYFSALRVACNLTFNQAAAKFRAAFSQQLYELEIEDKDVFNILNESAYASHLKAKIEFEPYLTETERKRLDKVWQSYYNYMNGIGQNIAPGSINVRKNEKDKALEILNNILEYARNR